jgi:HEAT repeat protein
VIDKLREGNLVGGKNLKLLTADHVPAMLEILNDEQMRKIARLQVLERLITLAEEGQTSHLDALINSKEEEIRLRIVQWLAQRTDRASAELLFDRLESEQEEVIKANIERSLQQIGRGLKEPDQVLLAKLIAKLKDPASKERARWASVLGGWHGEHVEDALIEALKDEDPKVRAAAARSLTGPAVRSLERVSPVLLSMLEYPDPLVRGYAVAGLEACTHPMRNPSSRAKCTERPLLNLLDVLPELPAAVRAHAARKDLSSKERRLIEKLGECIDKYAGEPDAEGAAAGGQD